MKFYSVPSFLEHVSASALADAACALLICHDEPLERGYILDRVKGFFLNHAIKVFSIKQGQGQAALDEVAGFDLFSNKNLILIEEVEKWGSKGLEALGQAFEGLDSANTTLVLTSSSPKGVESFYKAYDEKCACLDLSKEKPWDKDKRLALWCQEIGMRLGKKMSLEVANFLVEKGRGELALIESEVKAISAQIGGQKAIYLQDLQKASSALPAQLSWDFAKKLVYEEALGASQVFSRGIAEATFVSQVRYFLHIGLALTSKSHHEKRSSVEIAISKFSDQKRRAFNGMALKRGASFFQKGLVLLAEIESLIRNGGKEKELLETFCIRLEKEKLRG